MQSTRSKILRYLEDNPRSSAEDISRYLEMTAPNIRYHLEILKQEGLVQVSDSRSPGGAGRPILLYNLTSESLGNNLYPLLKTMLERIARSEKPREEIRQIAESFTGDKQVKTVNRVKRYNLAVEFLVDHNYRASWEARPGGPRIILRHCPYLDLASSHPLLCQFDEELLSSLCGIKLILTQKRSFGTDPYSPCVFNPSEKRKGGNER